MTTLHPDTPLVSNGFPLSARPERLGRLQPTDPTRPLADLREQYRAQGYLWLRGILDRREVLAFRRRYFAAFAGAGLPLLAQAPTRSTASATTRPRGSIRASTTR